jgi:probable phosphoglycerate mutase
MPAQKVLLIRHGETEWSLNGRHTGTTDIPLTENGRNVAREWKPVLSQLAFELVLTSPMQRARETCELTGLGQRAEVDNDIREWNYGDDEGLTAQQILAKRPSWMIFADGCPNGEGPSDVQSRVNRVIKKVRVVKGDVALFSHGHFLRSFVAVWLGLRVRDGSFFLLDPATVSVMSHYRDIPAVKHWNAPLIHSGTDYPML